MDSLTAFRTRSSEAGFGNIAATILLLKKIGDLDYQRFLLGFTIVRRLHHDSSQNNIPRFGCKSELATAARNRIVRRKLGNFSSSVVEHLRFNITIPSSPRPTISYVEVG